jgi:elongation factor Ts
MEITLEMIKELRAKTGAGIGMVKEALQSTSGDFEKALIFLREKGLAKAVKRSDKRAENGYIHSYIHGDGTLGVLVELNSETDFAARNAKFRDLAKEIALQIAANNPEYISIDQIPADIMQREKDLAMKDLDTKKPQNIIDKIVDGKLQKFYEDFVLLEQKYFKDESKRIKDLINDHVAVLGEKIEVGRFCRMKISSNSTACNL